MIRHRMVGILTGAAALTVSSCAVDQAPALSHVIPYGNTFQQVELISESEETGLRQQFSAALGTALSGNSIRVENGSDLVADFAISATSPETGLDPVTEHSGTADRQSTDKPRKRWFDICAPERVRGSLAIFDRQSNELVAKSEGHFIACPGNREQLNNLANLLVTSVLKESATTGQD